MASSRRIATGSVVGLFMLAITAMLNRVIRSSAAATQRRPESEAADAACLTKREFLDKMSHELRTPLNAIIGFSSILLKNKSGTLGQQELNYVSRIAVNGTHLLKLIDDILGFALLAEGRTEFDLRMVSVRDLLASVESLVAPLAQAKGITCWVQPFDDAIHVVADEERARHILLNLTTNAIRFTPEEGQVTLSCDLRDGWAHLHVSDDGRGIAAEKLSTIFEPFTQVGRALDRPTVGVGLGLAISRDLARGMGGELDVVSSEGWGSTFTLHLPSVLEDGERPD